MSSRKTTPKRSPTKKTAKQVAPNAGDISDTVVSSRSRPARESALKRKGAPDASDSEIGTVSGSVSPKKKKPATRPPSPGEEGFEDLPAVSFSATAGAPFPPIKLKTVATLPLSHDTPTPSAGPAAPVSSKKKKAVVRPPSPGEEGFEDLPAVSISAKVRAGLRSSLSTPSRERVVGTDPKGDVATSQRTRSRVRVKTEKARLLKEDQIVISEKKKLLSSEAIDESDEDASPKTIMSVDPRPSPRTPIKVPSMKFGSAVVNKKLIFVPGINVDSSVVGEKPDVMISINQSSPRTPVVKTKKPSTAVADEDADSPRSPDLEVVSPVVNKKMIKKPSIIVSDDDVHLPDIKKKASKKPLIAVSDDDDDSPHVKVRSPVVDRKTTKKPTIVLSDDDDDDSPRVKVRSPVVERKTAKKPTIVMSDGDDDDSPRVKIRSPVVERKTTKKPSIIVSDDDDRSPDVKKTPKKCLFLSSEEDVDSPRAHDIKKKTTKKPSIIVSGDGADSNGPDAGPPSPNPPKDISCKVEAADNLFDPVSNSNKAADSDVTSNAIRSSGSKGKGRKELPRAGVNEALLVMSESFQDPDLHELYENLPHLPKFCDVRSYLLSGSNTSQRVAYSKLAERLPASAMKSVLRGLQFVRSDCFVNTARIHPKYLVVEDNRLKLAGTTRHAVGIMLGGVTESYLVEPCKASPNANQFTVHKVTIAPFTQEMRRDTSAWGYLFGFQMISGNVSSDGISFHTRKENPGYGYAPESPTKTAGFNTPRSSPTKAKASGIFTTVSNPLVSALALGSKAPSYPASRGFNDKVPIYDGQKTSSCPAFRFVDDDFQNLASWPLYQGGEADVPFGAVVAVGYTLSTYVGSNSGVTYLSSNVQFVILLGLSA